MSIKGILLAGAALCTIAAAPALAKSAPNIHVLAAHAGGVVNKSAMHHAGATAVTYTFSVTTAVSTATNYKVKTNLARTYYTWLTSGSVCTTPKKEKVELSAKKTAYAKLGTSTETYTYSSCNGTPTKYYGDTYTLKTKKAAGSTDSFVSSLEAKFKNGGAKYSGTLNLDVSVSIGS